MFKFLCGGMEIFDDSVEPTDISSDDRKWSFQPQNLIHEVMANGDHQCGYTWKDTAHRCNTYDG